MPRVKSKRTLFVLCAASAALAACADEPGPALGVDRGSATVPDDPDDGSGSAPVQAIDGPEDVPPLCQSQFFGADPLSLEANARSCSFALAVAVQNPGNVQVQIGGQPRAAGDEENGWLLVDGSTVLLLGLACDDALAGADVELSALCE